MDVNIFLVSLISIYIPLSLSIYLVFVVLQDLSEISYFLGWCSFRTLIIQLNTIFLSNRISQNQGLSSQDGSLRLVCPISSNTHLLFQLRALLLFKNPAPHYAPFFSSSPLSLPPSHPINSTQSNPATFPHRSQSSLSVKANTFSLAPTLLSLCRLSGIGMCISTRMRGVGVGVDVV